MERAVKCARIQEELIAHADGTPVLRQEFISGQGESGVVVRTLRPAAADVARVLGLSAAAAAAELEALATGVETAAAEPDTAAADSEPVF